MILLPNRIARVPPQRRWRGALAALVSTLLLTVMPASAAPDALPGLPGLPVVSAAAWTETAVRKVLRTFAFGGQASDAQIAAWAVVGPRTAIVQMLNFSEHNQQLSPRDTTLPGENLNKRPNTLRALGDFWSSAVPANRMPVNAREGYRRSSWSGAMLTWSLAARARGGNPFRHRIGFWETNFHLAVDHLGAVTNYQLVRYYDDVMAALERGDSYERVLATAALSAAVGQQYGHRYNRYYAGHCFCNEDFAREFHQLAFGILGTGDSAYHEHTSIKDTALALTGMRFTSAQTPDEWQAEEVIFETAGHVPFPVEILHHTLADLK